VNTKNPTLATITVTFNPDLALLDAQLRALPVDCMKFIVDNASRPDVFVGINALAAQRPDVRILHNDANLGLAAAVNRGVHAAASMPAPATFVLLLDQDSEPQPNSVATLMQGFQDLETSGHHVGCVGPTLRDPQTKLAHGFHQCTRWRWKRAYPPVDSREPVPCANLNGSGTLVQTALFEQLGGLDESFFIDHVDTEWAFRVLHAGYGLWGIPNAVFDHRMGQASIRFWWFGWHVWPSRSPSRHYYLFRNAVTLMRRSYVPRVWKCWAVAKLTITAGVALLAFRNAAAQLSHMLRGVRDASATKPRRGCDQQR
jgi:rhamnosyltransferase